MMKKPAFIEAGRAQVVQRAAPILERLRACGIPLRDAMKVIHLFRFSLGISVAVVLLLTGVEQATEAFRVLAEEMNTAWDAHRWIAAVFHIGMLVLCISFLSMLCWYGAWLLAYLHEPDPPEASRWRVFVVAVGLVGSAFLPFAAVAFGAGIAARSYGAIEVDERAILWGLAALCAGLGVLAAIFFRRLQKRHPVVAPVRHESGLVALPREAKKVLGIAFAFSGLALLAFTANPWLAKGLGGPIALFVVAMSCMVPVGTLLVHYSYETRLPIVAIVAGLAVLFSTLDWNDNHEFRWFDDATAEREVRLVEFEDAFNDWLKERKDLERYDTYPVFIVAAEGGGLRAAYFTARVLAALQDTCPAFAQHLFAISGVSGGSLGAAAFAGLAKDAGKNERALPCELPGGKGGFFSGRADAIFAHDYLTGVAATALFPDLIQRFLFFKVRPVDRARTLERTLENAWDEAAKLDASQPDAQGRHLTPGLMTMSLFEAGFGAASGASPALFFNTTHVETGDRMIISTLYSRTAPLGRVDFLTNGSESSNLSVSTAAVASARFPLVTPAAFAIRSSSPTRIGKREDARKMRYVDGGYYDNSGTATLFDIFENLRELDRKGREKESPNRPKPIHVIVLMIGNSPMPNAERPQEQPLRTTGEWLGESLSPIRAMLNAREARSDESVRRMQAAVLLAGETAKGRAPETMTAQWAEFRLVNYKDRPLPLGWLLSAQSRGEMSRQLAFETGDCFKGYPLARVAENHNFCSLREVVTVLRAMRKRD